MELLPELGRAVMTGEPASGRQQQHHHAMPCHAMPRSVVGKRWNRLGATFCCFGTNDRRSIYTMSGPIMSSLPIRPLYIFRTESEGALDATGTTASK
jgi:hypothetical protein